MPSTFQTSEENSTSSLPPFDPSFCEDWLLPNPSQYEQRTDLEEFGYIDFPNLRESLKAELEMVEIESRQMGPGMAFSGNPGECEPSSETSTPSESFDVIEDFF